jgi:hypothetical protein
MYHDRTAWRFLWAKNMEAKDIHKEMLPMYGEHWLSRLPLVWPFKTSSFGRTLSWRWSGWKSSARVVPTATTIILRRRFPGTCETVGQVLKFVWRLCRKINVVCMSLSPFNSFQSRFVTYLLNRPRTNRMIRLSESPFSCSMCVLLQKKQSTFGGYQLADHGVFRLWLRQSKRFVINSLKKRDYFTIITISLFLGLMSSCLATILCLQSNFPYRCVSHAISKNFLRVPARILIFRLIQYSVIQKDGTQFLSL